MYKKLYNKILYRILYKNASPVRRHLRLTLLFHVRDEAVDGSLVDVQAVG